MNEAELDAVYSALCRRMTEIGERDASLFLARFALLAIERIGDREAIESMIGAAAEGIGGARDDRIG